jgi:predicted TIM-barrel fold metal-dependent hydrolase
MALTRRRFLATAGAVTAISSARQTSASVPEGSDRGAIDCQSHLFVPEILNLMEKRSEDPVVYRKGEDRYVRMGDWHRRVLPKHTDVGAKIADMDEAGIARTALSINDPGPEWFGAEGRRLAGICNDFIAGVVAEHPDRFFGLCVLPLQDMKASLQELDRCVRQLGMKGILLYTNLAGRFPDEPALRPLFARAADLDIPILLHPAKPVTTDVVKDYEMTSSLGNMFEDTIALTRIIMAGILDEYPSLKLVCPHLGGTLPYIIGRLDHQVTVLKRGPGHLKRLPSEYLKQVYLDIVSPLPLAIRFAYDFMGSDRLVFGSDHPWVDPKLILASLSELNLPPDAMSRILFGNARRLFGI